MSLGVYGRRRFFATRPTGLVTIPGIKHYGIYNEARGRAQKEAIAWLDEHLK